MELVLFVAYIAFIVWIVDNLSAVHHEQRELAATLGRVEQKLDLLLKAESRQEPPTSSELSAG